MELKEFIATGIIESYLLGTATPKEIEMVNTMLVKYPSLKIEIDAVEEALLNVAESNVETPNEKLKEKIFSSIPFGQAPVKNEEIKNDTSKTVPFVPSQKRKGLVYGLVATIAFLIISTILNVVMFGSSVRMGGQMAKMYKENTEMKASLLSYMDMMDDMKKQFKVLTDTNSQMIRLKGTTVSPSSLATVCWNKQSNKVYLYVKDLPEPPTEMQYQLWAIVDGKPVDAGVFDTNKGTTLQDMLRTEGTPQAFAVTLEKKGGSPTPNLDAMYLIGNV